jgi:hypothetical protein
MIPADDDERVIEGAEPAQPDDAGFGEQIAAKRFGVNESDDDEGTTHERRGRDH